jgi:hypothetical protein
MKERPLKRCWWCCNGGNQMEPNPEDLSPELLSQLAWNSSVSFAARRFVTLFWFFGHLEKD